MLQLKRDGKSHVMSCHGGSWLTLPKSSSCSFLDFCPVSVACLPLSKVRCQPFRSNPLGFQTRSKVLNLLYFLDLFGVFDHYLLHSYLASIQFDFHKCYDSIPSLFFGRVSTILGLILSFDSFVR